MDNTTEEFVSEEEMKKRKILGNEFALETVEVGQSFQFAGIKFRIRKVTAKDIICRPVDWDQNTDE